MPKESHTRSNTRPRFPAAGAGASAKDRLRQRLAEYRGRHPTQAEVAKALGKTHSWVSKIETGRAELKNPLEVRAYARAIGAPVPEILALWEAQFDEVHGYFGGGAEEPGSASESDGDAKQRLVQTAAHDWLDSGLQDEIPLDVLCYILEHDVTAKLAAKAWCADFLKRNPSRKKSADDD